ncbi:hypothetical protein [Curtobacterium sp. NPDC089185]|jgi:hypothetical protein|uniref:hypothetical protein n=1 Tax=Curtobacterium sp. NPDC089185 TaxID=3154968 RepID=UPI00343B02C1
MRTWTAGDAVELVERSWRWMSFVTTPVTITVGAGWSFLADGGIGAPDGPPALALTILLLAVVAGLVTIGGAIVALPCTYALGWALTRFAARLGVHVVAHALLAGALAALCVWLLETYWSHAWAPLPGLRLLIALSAAAAAAIATWRTAAVPRRRPRRVPTCGADGSAGRTLDE